MGKYSMIFILILILKSSILHSREISNTDEKIIWSNEYNIKYEVIHVLDGISERYEVWYMKEDELLRVDINGGEVKKFYSRSNHPEENIILYMLHPETSDQLTIETGCYTNNMTLASVMRVMPLTTRLSYKGTQNFNGIAARLFYDKIKVARLLTFERTLYVYRVNDYDVPIQYVARIFNSANGALSSHTVTNFYEYYPVVAVQDVLIPKDFDVDECVRAESIKLSTETDFLYPSILLNLDEAFLSYKTYHDKEYYDDEHQLRKSIFQKNWREVLNHNRQNLSFKMALNQFSDRTDNELKSMGCILKLHHSKNAADFSEELKAMAVEMDLPEHLDLRMKGLVTPVKNQMTCGSCWSFGTTAVLEGAIALKNGGKLLDLSEQFLIDCSWGYSNKGCIGGNLESTLRFVLEEGIPTEQEYGMYLMQEGTCHIENVTETLKIKGFGRVTPHSEVALKVALNKYGPVVVGIYASDVMIKYSSGVFYDKTCQGLQIDSVNHAVTIMGYGTRDGAPYWLVKNSWGETWGEAGYMLLSAEGDNCFVLDEGFYAIA